ncbi:DCC1-like thiol-disulfide oxidoreductase family protein [Flavobacterium luminosum]|uniref:DCC1-like thiol-disulfide oxidoreductase family protein n=1 Tax=Flavobacterium luminosum TaxID=2949086 RepID=A0ABT0TP95_9FLAO|nr:DCC1-like thiol-disulfide oxidoreductase family protein [Flavobacterium sp. HXWNR70]MCL9809101.1 DCC1-like thiol-disulfide oxidoreductase family protein [Flavobacterium sp. HXWNR70]
MKNIINSLFTTKVDAIGISVFRMFYSVVLFLELLQLYTFRSIIYDKEPYQYTGEIDVSFIFYFWFPVVVFLFLGLFTRYITILNYIFGVIIFSSAIKFEYHVFYAYVGINFLLIFMPISRVLSLDSLLKKLKYSTLYKPFLEDRKVLKINYVIPVFVAIGLVYFDSIFHKLSSKMWMDGLGVWLPSSLPMVTWNDTSVLLNQKGLMLFLGYLVLAFETVFIFLFWFKKFRVPFFILGVFFHVGILIAYPIPWFALTVIAVYLLLVPVKYWKFLASKIKCKNPIYTFYYDLECPLCNKVVIVIRHFDIFNTVECLPVQGNYKNNEALLNYDEETLLINIHGVTSSGKVVSGFWAYVSLLKAMRYTYLLGLLISLPLISSLGQKIYDYIAGNRVTERCTAENCTIPIYTPPPSENDDFLIKGWNKVLLTTVFWKCVILFLSFGQLLMIWFSPTIQNNFPKVEKINKFVFVLYEYSRDVYTDFFGITHHAVFIFDDHFKTYNKIFRIEAIDVYGNKIDFPLLDKNGMPSKSYENGSVWANAAFRVNSSNFKLSIYSEEIIKYLKYFEVNSKYRIVSYKVYYKEVYAKEKWEYNFLKNQINTPWRKAGEIFKYVESYEFKWEDDFVKKLN